MHNFFGTLYIVIEIEIDADIQVSIDIDMYVYVHVHIYLCVCLYTNSTLKRKVDLQAYGSTEVGSTV